MKHSDYELMKNPLKESKKISMINMKVYQKMLKCRLYPIKEPLLNMPHDWHFQIDSLTAIGYNSQDNCKNADKPPDVLAPANSIHSVEEIDFQSSTDEEIKEQRKVEDETRKQLEEDKKRKEERQNEIKKQKEDEMEASKIAEESETMEKDQIQQLSPEKQRAIKQAKIKKESDTYQGFDIAQLKGYPSMMQEGAIPNNLLNYSLEGSFKNLKRQR